MTGPQPVRSGPPGAGGRGGGRGPGGPPAPAPAPPVPDEDYNFEEANKHFNKAAALREAEAAVKAHPSAYKKDDFFDMVSCEALDKKAIAEGSGMGRRNMHEQRAVDIETFGGAGGVRHYRGGFGGRGGGRGSGTGGRGGGGGAGAGGYGSRTGSSGGYGNQGGGGGGSRGRGRGRGRGGGWL